MKEVIFSMVEKFINNAKDSDIGKENANFIRSLPVLENIMLGYVCKKYLFEVIYKNIPEIEVLHNNCFIYHHQTSKLSVYCIGLSSYEIVLKGLTSTATNERASSPPKRVDTLLSQAANLICLLSQEVSGATSINDLSTTCAGYMYHMEKVLGMPRLTEKEIENAFQSFIYNVNLPFRAGNSPFSNITLDFAKAAPTLAHKSVVYAGEYQDYCYADIPAEYFDFVNKAFINAMNRGDRTNNPFTFPLITVNVTDDFDYSNPCFQYLLEKSENFGGFYLQNYCTPPFNEETRKINPFHEPYDIGTLYSNCCRMTFSLNEIIKTSGSNPFASGSGIGGINVIGINLNRLLWLSQGDERLLFEMIDYLMDISGKALETKRAWARANWKELYPYLSFYVVNDKTLFSIISVLGMHEGLMSAGFKDGIYDEQGKELAHRIARHIRAKTDQLTEKYGNAFTLEFAPSETAACKMAEEDLIFAHNLIDGVPESFSYTLPVFSKSIEKCLDKNFNKLFIESI